jgi:hypothetical protein
MNLIDTPNKSGNHYLDELLFPLPIEFPHEDCYVPVSDSTRWRSFINSEQWTPEQHNKDLLSRREYHARMVWETCMMIALTDIDWVCTDSLIALREIGHLELRITEIAIVSYQLTCGMVGIGARERQKLYHCAINLFMCNMFMSKAIGAENHLLLKLEELRPKASDSKKDLCRLIDLAVFGVHQMLSKGLNMINENDNVVIELGRRLRDCIKSLDLVLIVQ